MSQQLSTRAAATIYTGRIGALLPNGTPTPRALQQLSDEALRGAGLQQAEARLYAGSQPESIGRHYKQVRVFRT